VEYVKEKKVSSGGPVRRNGDYHPESQCLCTIHGQEMKKREVTLAGNELINPLKKK